MFEATKHKESRPHKRRDQRMLISKRIQHLCTCCKHATYRRGKERVYDSQYSHFPFRVLETFDVAYTVCC